MTSPELNVSQWFNTNEDITLTNLRGKVVLIEAFQMLCPGCVTHGLPLAKKVQQAFPQEKVAVLGLHTVFEHHEAMKPVSLEAFLHEYRITFPVGVDAEGVSAMPKTMETYQMRGTPSMLLIDKKGMLRANHFGDVSELLLGAEIATLLNEVTEDATVLGTDAATGATCGAVKHPFEPSQVSFTQDTRPISRAGSKARGL